MLHIVVVGSLNMDLVVRVPSIPVPGETVLGDNFATIPGGKGANQAVAAARLGAHVSLIGRVEKMRLAKNCSQMPTGKGLTSPTSVGMNRPLPAWP